MIVELITDAAQKEQASFTIMEALPEWFTPIEDVREKSKEHRSMPLFLAKVNNETVGFIALKVHNEHNIEIYNFGVLKEFQRQGVGGQLLKAAERYAQEQSFYYITVKTLAATVNYEPYERTRNFYHKNNFVDLEIITNYWNEANPCLIMIKRSQV